MDAREAFKFGFMARLADAGIAREKAAVLDVPGKLTQALGKLTPLAAYTALLGPPVAGLGAGYLGGRMSEADEEEIAELKHRELMRELQRHTARARRRHPQQASAAPPQPQLM